MACRVVSAGVCAARLTAERVSGGGGGRARSVSGAVVNAFAEGQFVGSRSVLRPARLTTRRTQRVREREHFATRTGTADLSSRRTVASIRSSRPRRCDMSRRATARRSRPGSGHQRSCRSGRAHAIRASLKVSPGPVVVDEVRDVHRPSAGDLSRGYAHHLTPNHRRIEAKRLRGGLLPCDARWFRECDHAKLRTPGVP